MSDKTKQCANRAAQALRLAAAHKLARLIHSMLTNGEEYTDQDQAYYEDRYRQRVLHNLNRRAQQLGLKLAPTSNAPAAA